MSAVEPAHAVAERMALEALAPDRARGGCLQRDGLHVPCEKAPRDGQDRDPTGRGRACRGQAMARPDCGEPSERQCVLGDESRLWDAIQVYRADAGGSTRAI